MKMLNREVVRKYFDDLHTLLVDNKIGVGSDPANDKPYRIWNCDETGIKFESRSPWFEHKPKKVIAKTGACNVTARTSPGRDNITLLVCTLNTTNTSK